MGKKNKKTEEIKESKESNVLTDEEMKEYKQLKKEKKKQEQEHLVSVVWLGSIIYGIIGGFIFYYSLTAENMPMLLVGGFLLLFSIIQLVLAYSKEPSKGLKNFLYIVNGIPTAILYILDAIA